MPESSGSESCPEPWCAGLLRGGEETSSAQGEKFVHILIYFLLTRTMLYGLIILSIKMIFHTFYYINLHDRYNFHGRYYLIC